MFPISISFQIFKEGGPSSCADFNGPPSTLQFINHQKEKTLLQCY